MRDFRDGILLKLLETRLYFGMKIKIGLLLCFTFLEKINNNKTSPYRFPTKLIAVGGRFQLADANELELKHRIFFVTPTGKNEHYFP